MRGSGFRPDEPRAVRSSHRDGLCRRSGSGSGVQRPRLTHYGSLSRFMADSARVVGRYEVLEEIAAGGMATIHLGRVLGGSSSAPKFIAVKRMHAQYARDPDFRSMFMD